jgi:dnd system-associated protein 4
MADIRIKVAKDKAKLVKALRAGEGSTGPFQTYVDILVFAAVLGFKEKKLINFLDFSKKDPDPIPIDHFNSKNSNQIIDLIAMCHIQNPKILGKNEDNEREKYKIFEAYANGGLDIISSLCAGSQDISIQVLLFIQKYKTTSLNSDSDLFDLTFL